MLFVSLITTLGPCFVSAGDGVNDVAAMKTADVAVALLNGFGDEHAIDTTTNVDMDEQRRLQLLAKRRIGSNRKKKVEMSTEGRKRKPTLDPAMKRISTSIEKQQKEIAARAAARQGLSPETNPKDIQFTSGDAKDMILATFRAVRQERRRNSELRKGGGAAARILARERRQMMRNAATEEGESETGENLHEEDSLEPEDDSTVIKPGEASLVASFSCLHPSIDGVDSILRSGVASAACALATQQNIVLHALMASFNLASLYRDGFRYGQNMWRVEMFFFVFVDRASYVAACSSRPRLPLSVSFRPPVSMFHPAYVVSTVGQAVIHLASLTLGAWYGKHLEFGSREEVKGATQIRAIPVPGASKLNQLSAAMVEKYASHELNDDDSSDEEGGFFRRPKFTPNYETNVVFINSIVQAAVSSVINHKGRPFYGSILESRALCNAFGLTVLFAVACVTGSFPLLNRILEIRNFPSRRSMAIVLAIAAIDAGACYLVQLAADQLFLPSSPAGTKDGASSKKKAATSSAADEEEKLLQEESKQNMFRLLIILCIACQLFLQEMISPSS